MRKNGFTILEMLVVAVLTISFVFLLIPAYSTARQGSLEQKCMDNLRQLGQITSMYLEEYDGWFYHHSRHIGEGSDSVGERSNWVQMMSDYSEKVDIEEDGILHCPANVNYHRHRAFVSYGVLFFGVANWPFNRNISGHFYPQARTGQVWNADRTILLADSAHRGYEDRRSYHIISQLPAHFTRSFAWRHDDAANVLFADGSVRSYSSSDPGHDEIMDSDEADLNVWLRTPRRSHPLQSPLKGEIDFLPN